MNEEKTLEFIHEWIKVADQKISIFLAFVSAVFGLCLLPAIKILNESTFSCKTEWFYIFSILALTLMAITISTLLYALSPRTKKDARQKSPIFFHDIANMTKENFLEKMLLIDYKKEVLSQIYETSKVCSFKHRLFTLAVKVFVLAFISFLIAIFFYTHVII